MISNGHKKEVLQNFYRKETSFNRCKGGNFTAHAAEGDRKVTIAILIDKATIIVAIDTNAAPLASSRFTDGNRPC